jgi:hypothetical protein
VIKRGTCSIAKTVQQMWSHLGLVPILNFTKHYECYSILRINLNHNRQQANENNRAPHRLFINVPCADVKPPQGIPVVYLSSVEFKMEFVTQRHISRPKRRKLNQLSRQPLTLSLTPPVRLSFPPQQPRENQVDLIHVARNDKCILSPTAHKGTVRELEEMLNRKNTIYTHADPFKTACLTSEQEDSYIELEVFVKLTDAAVRHFICNRPHRLAPGIKVEEDKIKITLAEVAPTLWSPRFLPVSECIFKTPYILRSAYDIYRTSPIGRTLSQQYVTL